MCLGELCPEGKAQFCAWHFDPGVTDGPGAWDVSPRLPRMSPNFSRGTRRKAFALHFEFPSVFPFVSLSPEDVLSLILVFKEKELVVKWF